MAEGSDVLILAIGRTVADAQNARKRLLGHGIDAAVINCRFVKPLDSGLIAEWASRIPNLITVEEHMLEGGFGSAVLECLAERQVAPQQIRRLGIRDIFVEHGSQGQLRRIHEVDEDAIVDAALEMIPESTIGRAALFPIPKQ
jgi:1-deoxy-D-xylulose-5-phosphate synthase